MTATVRRDWVEALRGTPYWTEPAPPRETSGWRDRSRAAWRVSARPIARARVESRRRTYRRRHGRSPTGSMPYGGRDPIPGRVRRTGLRRRWVSPSAASGMAASISRRSTARASSVARGSAAIQRAGSRAAFLLGRRGLSSPPRTTGSRRARCRFRTRPSSKSDSPDPRSVPADVFWCIAPVSVFDTELIGSRQAVSMWGTAIRKDVLGRYQGVH